MPTTAAPAQMSATSTQKKSLLQWFWQGINRRIETYHLAAPMLGWVGALPFILIGPRHPRWVWQATINGRQFWLRWCDWCAVQEVLVEHEYAIVKDCLAGHSQPVVLDLGANIGTFSLYVLGQTPAARLSAYEPDTDTFALLQKTANAQAGISWAVHRAAAWKEDGEVRFEATSFSTGSRVNADGKVSVPARSLSSIMAALSDGPVALAKIDIEGSEADVLVNQDALLQRIENLIIELHPGRCDTESVVATLQRVYPHLQQIPGRRSSKPLLLASRQRYAALPLYQPPAS